MSQSFCFCTLAVGRRYRTHARQLAEDIQKYAPGAYFFILTDKPAEFSVFPHVLAYKHQLESVRGYHDKRIVIEKAITKFETCLFLDSDVRILGPVPTDINFPPGLTGRFGCQILKHNKYDKVRPSLSLIETISKPLNLQLEDVIWLHECMFAVRRQEDLEEQFFRHWKVLAYYFQMNGIYGSEGNVMGLAAATAGLNASFQRTDPFPFFKDNIEKERIKEGKSTLEEKAAYFQAHRDIEFPSRGLIQKVTNKVRQQVSFYYRLAEMNVAAAKDIDLQTLHSLLYQSEAYNRS